MPNCTAMRSSGNFCDRESLPDAPFPICLKHAASMLQFLNERVSEAGPALQVAREIASGEMPEVRRQSPLTATWRGTQVVYYLRVGDHIKVGYSGNLVQRLRAYPPDAELLAYEHGNRTLEAQRLKQFGRYKQAGLEWFAPGPLLLQHIQSLQSAAA